MPIEPIIENRLTPTYPDVALLGVRAARPDRTPCQWEQPDEADRTHRHDYRPTE